MTKEEFNAITECMPVHKQSKAHEAARRVLVLNEPAIRVAEDLGLSVGNVRDACVRINKTKAKLDAWCNRS